MYYKWFECICRTFYNQFFAFDYVQYIHTAICMMSNFTSKPVSACFDKFIFMQTCTFFSPAFSRTHRFYMVDKVFASKFCLTFPLNYF